MNRYHVASWSVLVLLVAVAGCGGDSAGKAPAAPKTAGDAASLAGTTWTDPETNVQYAFVDAQNVQTLNPAVGQPVPGGFTVDNGIVSVNVGFQSIDGTWDGQTLVLAGKTLTKTSELAPPA